jgi:hypothetical protein
LRGLSKVAQTDANQSVTLMQTKVHFFSQLQDNVRQFLEGRRSNSGDTAGERFGVERLAGPQQRVMPWRGIKFRNALSLTTFVLYGEDSSSSLSSSNHLKAE